MLTEGAFLVGASRDADGCVAEVRVTSRAGGTFRLANPWPVPARVRRASGRATRAPGAVLELALQAGERLTLTR